MAEKRMTRASIKNTTEKKKLQDKTKIKESVEKKEKSSRGRKRKTSCEISLQTVKHKHDRARRKLDMKVKEINRASSSLKKFKKLDVEEINKSKSNIKPLKKLDIEEINKSSSDLKSLKKWEIKEINKSKSSVKLLKKLNMEEINKSSSSFKPLKKSDIEEVNKSLSDFKSLKKLKNKEINKSSAILKSIKKSDNKEINKSSSDLKSLKKLKTKEKNKPLCSLKAEKLDMEEVNKSSSSIKPSEKSVIKEINISPSKIKLSRKSDINEINKSSSSLKPLKNDLNKNSTSEKSQEVFNYFFKNSNKDIHNIIKVPTVKSSRESTKVTFIDGIQGEVKERKINEVQCIKIKSKEIENPKPVENLHSFQNSKIALTKHCGSNLKLEPKILDEIEIIKETYVQNNKKNIASPKINSELSKNFLMLKSAGMITLQTLIETFISQFQANFAKKEIDSLKRDLCKNWLNNNFLCPNQNCIHIHNAYDSFFKKLKIYPSKNIMFLVVSMKNDPLFVDIVLVAFEILRQRHLPAVWITFLVFFVFYVIEPSDRRFLKFWINSARFYTELNPEYSAANGFTSLLSVFTQGHQSEEWKIIEFVKLFKEPPIQTDVNFALLQPLSNMELPTHFYIEALEFSIKTQKNMLHVYFYIIPKLKLMTLPMNYVELLLNFCNNLESMNFKTYAGSLRQRLIPKIRTFKIKVVEQDFPFTALLQNEILSERQYKTEKTSQNFYKVISQKDEEYLDFNALNKKNYFEPNGDLCSHIIRTMKFTFDSCVSDLQKEERKSIDGGIKSLTAKIISEEEQIKKLKQYFYNCQFDLLGKYLNEFKENIVLKAAKELLQLLFLIKVSLDRILLLLTIMISNSKTENSAKVISCLCVTLIFYFVRAKEWNKAYSVISLCHKKQIRVVDGKVLISSDLNPSPFKIALLLVQINAYKEDYAAGLELIKAHHLFSCNQTLWNLAWKNNDEITRINILDAFLRLLISSHSTKMAYELFWLIWTDQNQIKAPIDLRKFVDDILKLLLNENTEEAIVLFEKTQAEVELKINTVRGVLVTFVRNSRLNDAKNVLVFRYPNLYTLPQAYSNHVVMTVSIFWLEEEIYLLLENLLNGLALMAYQNKRFPLQYPNVFITIVKEWSSLNTSMPLCLDLMNPSFYNTCLKIQRVLQHNLKPSLNFEIIETTVKIDKASLKCHLDARINDLEFKEIETVKFKI